MNEIANDGFFLQLVDSRNFEMMVVFGIGGTIAIIAILAGTITGVIKARAREATKREIAAYVAEGSIKPDEAVAMLNAGRSLSERVG